MTTHLLEIGRCPSCGVKTDHVFEWCGWCDSAPAPCIDLPGAPKREDGVHRGRVTTLYRAAAADLRYHGRGVGADVT